mgnify:CR=1 FL=1
MNDTTKTENYIKVENNFKVKESSLVKFSEYQRLKNNVEWHLVHLLKSMANHDPSADFASKTIMGALSGLHLNTNYKVNDKALKTCIANGKDMRTSKSHLESRKALADRLFQIEGWLILLLANLTKSGFKKSHLATQVAASIQAFNLDGRGDFDISSLYRSVNRAA